MAIIDLITYIMGRTYELLLVNSFMGTSLLVWSASFLVVSFCITVFWKGAQG